MRGYQELEGLVSRQDLAEMRVHEERDRTAKLELEHQKECIDGEFGEKVDTVSMKMERMAQKALKEAFREVYGILS